MSDKQEVINAANTWEKNLKNAEAQLESLNDTIEGSIGELREVSDLVRDDDDMVDAIEGAIQAIEDLYDESERTGDLADEFRAVLEDNE